MPSHATDEGGLCQNKFGVWYEMSVGCAHVSQTINSSIYSFYFFADRLIGTALPIWTALYFLGPSLKVCRCMLFQSRSHHISPFGCAGRPSASGFAFPLG